MQRKHTAATHTFSSQKDWKHPLHVSTIKIIKHTHTLRAEDLLLRKTTRPRHATEHAEANTNCVCVYSDRTPKPSWSLSKYGHMVSLCGERQRQSMRVTQRWFLACFPHLSTGRPQQAKTSYPLRTCVPFPKLKRLAFLTPHITPGSRSEVSTLGYVMMRLLRDENKGIVVPDWLVSYVSSTEGFGEVMWSVYIM